VRDGSFGAPERTPAATHTTFWKAGVEPACPSGPRPENRPRFSDATTTKPVSGSLMPGEPLGASASQARISFRPAGSGTSLTKRALKSG
jgi:hypothetical protein